jgi:hypothetical protein
MRPDHFDAKNYKRMIAYSRKKKVRLALSRLLQNKHLLYPLSPGVRTVKLPYLQRPGIGLVDKGEYKQ